jgi:ABC-2 type transport system permease protein
MTAESVALQPGASLPVQVLVLVRRLVDEFLSEPIPLLGAFVFTPGFLVVQDGLLGGTDAVASAAGGDYFAFIVAGGVLMSTVVAGAAGFVMTRDKDDGYVDRLLTMPLSRAAIVLGPILFGAGYAVLNAAVVLSVCAVLGAAPASGLPGALAILLVAGCWGVAIASYMVVAAIVTGSIELVRMVDVAFFPALFLSPVVLPRDRFKGWTELIADLNPLTYAVEGIRALMVDGWDMSRLGPALAVSVGVVCLTVLAASAATSWAVARR